MEAELPALPMQKTKTKTNKKIVSGYQKIKTPRGVKNLVRLLAWKCNHEDN
jgi:hypothetical protein